METFEIVPVAQPALGTALVSIEYTATEDSAMNGITRANLALDRTPSMEKAGYDARVQKALDTLILTLQGTPDRPNPQAFNTELRVTEFATVFGAGNGGYEHVIEEVSGFAPVGSYNLGAYRVKPTFGDSTALYLTDADGLNVLRLSGEEYSANYGAPWNIINMTVTDGQDMAGGVSPVQNARFLHQIAHKATGCVGASLVVVAIDQGATSGAVRRYVEQMDAELQSLYGNTPREQWKASVHYVESENFDPTELGKTLGLITRTVSLARDGGKTLSATLGVSQTVAQAKSQVATSNDDDLDF